ncbi:ABC1 kinase family protein [Fodinicola feengrottensis]|uniref:ABC1 kinase family protein n=1 Tax=Fodinicola feengrottensis TaxID=435914 RepID=UPI0013D2DACF|nr:AarF/UbiB family protein [Fodinicola feengrottensis]
MIETVVVVAAAALFAVCAGMVARRVLGTPVGWPRTFVVGLVVYAGSSPFATFVAAAAGLRGGPDHLSVSVLVAAAFILLAFGWLFAFGVAALVAVEAIWPTGSVPNPLRLVRDLVGRRRRTRRYLAILSIASRHGLSRVLRGRRVSQPELERTPVALVAALNEAGVTFVKLGQLLSTRRDLLPDRYVEALSHLQTRARPVRWDEIRAVIEAELGGPIDTFFFAEVDPKPLAAASVAQVVHAARLADGTDVVVKVQRPTAQAQVRADVDIIVRLASWIETRTDWGRDLGAVALAEGFAQSLRDELDYRTEHRHMEMIRKASGESLLAVPLVFPTLCGQRILTMQRFDGVPVGDAASALAKIPDSDRRALAANLCDEVLRQILVHGVFHADLHPGNLMLREDRTIGLLDFFGSVGVLDRETREALAAFLQAVDNDDNAAATDALLLLAEAPESLDMRTLRRDLGAVVTSMRYQTGAGVFTQFLDVVRVYRLGVPPYVAAAFRTITALEGALTLIDPRFDLVAYARSIAPRLGEELFPPEQLAAAAKSRMAAFLAVSRRIPGRLEAITANLESGRLAVRFRPFADPDDRVFLASLVTDGVSALVAVAAVVSAIVLVVTDAGPLIAPNVRLDAFAGYVIGFFGFVLILRSVVRGFVRPRRRS